MKEVMSRKVAEGILDLFDGADGIADEMSPREIDYSNQFYKFCLDVGLDPFASGEKRFPKKLRRK